MKNLIKKIKQNVLRHDLLKHFFVGFGIYLFILVVLAIFGSRTPSFFATLITMLVMIGKDVVYDDMLGYGDFSFWDICYGCFPAVVCQILIMTL